MSDKIFVVETISVFRHTYYVRAKEATHAMDEVVCNIENHSDSWVEGSQYHVGENIANCIEVTEEEFLQLFNKENEYLKNWKVEQKFGMINVIDYGKD